jgi:hypothetical protein
MKKRVVTKEKITLLIFIFFMVTLMWACATEPLTKEVWSKPKSTQQEFTKDRYDCMKEARGTAEPKPAEGEVVKNVGLYNYCMEARGWKLKEVSDNIETNIFADGTKYEGNIVKGKMNGKGTYTWANGDKYQGNWVDGKMNGRGTNTCSNGNQFTGNFEDNKSVGFTVKCN